jgi:hypothetical protein
LLYAEQQFLVVDRLQLQQDCGTAESLQVSSKCKRFAVSEFKRFENGDAHAHGSAVPAAP